VAGVRAFQAQDVSGVVALRRKCFAVTEQQDDAALASYLAEVFFDSPFTGGEPDAAVFEAKDGSIAGFHGRIARPIRYAGKTGTMLVGTQLMADPGASGFPGVQLLRDFFKSEVDLCLADAGNTESRGIWRSLGGTELAAQSMNWVLPLKPQYHLRHLGKSTPARALRATLRRVMDVLPLSVGAQLAAQGGRSRAATAAEVVEVCGEFAGKALAPALSAQQFAWIETQLKASGAIHSRLVEDATGEALGWYCMRPQAGAVARVLGVYAAQGKLDPVLDRLCLDALGEGAYAVQGRVENWMLEALGARHCEFNRAAPWFLVHSREQKIMQMLHAGDARFTLLDGERSLRF